MTPQREKVLTLWAEMSTLFPDMRMGQLLTWFAGAVRGPNPESLYDVEDEELIEVMSGYLAARRAEVNEPLAAAG